MIYRNRIVQSLKIDWMLLKQRRYVETKQLAWLPVRAAYMVPTRYNYVIATNRLASVTVPCHILHHPHSHCSVELSLYYCISLLQRTTDPNYNKTFGL